MSIATALTALNSDVVNARNKIVEMGGAVTPNGGTSQLSADIATIPQGGGVSIIPLDISKNGEYTAPDGFAYSPVTVNVQGGGPALINGRKFECGTFTFPTAVTANYTIQHNLGVTPSAVFLWVVDPDYSVAGQIGKFRADHTTDMNSIAISAVNRGISASSGASGNRYRTVWDSTTITFNCDSAYPLLPNMEYQWLAIA